MFSYPILSDGETSVEFKPDGLLVISPSFEKEVFLPMNEVRRNFYLTKMNTENMYIMLEPLTKYLKV